MNEKPISHLGAIYFAIAAYTLWVLTDSAIKLAGRSKLPSYEVVAFLGSFIALFLGLFSLSRGKGRALWPKRPSWVALRGLFDFGNNFFVVIALRHLSLTLFYILVFTAPMVVVLLGRLFLREPLGWRRAAAIVAGFLGVVVAVNPFQSFGKGDWIGYAACSICVSCFSAEIVWSRVLARTEQSESITFFSGLVTAAAGFSLMLLHAAPLTARLFSVLVAMGLLCALGNLCFITAVKHTTVANVSQFHYTQLISGAIIAYFLFHEKPTIAMLIGAILIFASGFYIARLARRDQPYVAEVSV